MSSLRRPSVGPRSCPRGWRSDTAASPAEGAAQRVRRRGKIYPLESSRQDGLVHVEARGPRCLSRGRTVAGCAAGAYFDGTDRAPRDLEAEGRGLLRPESEVTDPRTGCRGPVRARPARYGRLDLGSHPGPGPSFDATATTGVEGTSESMPLWSEYAASLLEAKVAEGRLSSSKSRERWVNVLGRLVPVIGRISAGRAPDRGSPSSGGTRSGAGCAMGCRQRAHGRRGSFRPPFGSDRKRMDLDPEGHLRGDGEALRADTMIRAAASTTSRDRADVHSTAS